jgi:hypothetical protein
MLVRERRKHVRFRHGLLYTYICKMHAEQKCSKNFFSTYHIPFDREFQGGQEHVCLAFFKPFFPIETLKKLERCEKHTIWQLFLDSSFL